MAEEMLSPAVAAAVRAGDVAKVVRDEIARAGEAADDARETLLALREALALESERLVENTDMSLRATRELTTTLGRERSEMGALAHSLDAQAARVTDSISQQAKMVAEATELADTQLREAEAVLSARAADLAAAAGEASNAARTAGEDLTRHIARLETAGTGVADQVRAVESGLTEQRTALITLTQGLKADHAGFADQAEAHAAKLSEFIEPGARTSSAGAQRAGAEGWREPARPDGGSRRSVPRPGRDRQGRARGVRTSRPCSRWTTVSGAAARAARPDWKPRPARPSRRWRASPRKPAPRPPATRPPRASRWINFRRRRSRPARRPIRCSRPGSPRPAPSSSNHLRWSIRRARRPPNAWKTAPRPRALR